MNDSDDQQPGATEAAHLPDPDQQAESSAAEHGRDLTAGSTDGAASTSGDPDEAEPANEERPPDDGEPAAPPEPGSRPQPQPQARSGDRTEPSPPPRPINSRSRLQAALAAAAIVLVAVTFLATRAAYVNREAASLSTPTAETLPTIPPPPVLDGTTTDPAAASPTETPADPGTPSPTPSPEPSLPYEETVTLKVDDLLNSQIDLDARPPAPVWTILSSPRGTDLYLSLNEGPRPFLASRATGTVMTLWDGPNEPDLPGCFQQALQHGIREFIDPKPGQRVCLVTECQTLGYLAVDNADRAQVTFRFIVLDRRTGDCEDTGDAGITKL